MMFNKKITLTLLLLCTNTLYSMNPFTMPGGLKAIKRVAPKKPMAHKPVSPLESEILTLGDDFKRIADELVKIPSDKEVKQALEKKRTERDKQYAQGKKAATGGYRPGSYKPSSSFGGGYGRPGSPSGGFGRPSSPFGGFGRGFGGGGYGSSRGGGFGGVVRSTGGADSPFGSSDFFKRSDTSDSKIPLPTDATGSPPAKSPGRVGHRAGRETDRDTEALREKITNQLTSYVDKFEKSLAGTSDKTVREKRVKNMPLAELNKLYDEIESSRQGMKKEEIKILEKSADWKSTIAKLATLRTQAIQVLLELMIPSSTPDTAKIAEAGRTLTNLNQFVAGTKSSTQQVPQSIVEARCKAVAEEFTALARQRERKILTKLANDQFGKDDATRLKLEQDAKQERITAKTELADTLDAIIAAFPADKLGSPVPAVLSTKAAALRKK